MNQTMQKNSESDFEGTLQDFYKQERKQIEIPLDRLLARAGSVYSGVTPTPAPPQRGWLDALSSWWVRGSLGASALAAACMFFMFQPEAPVTPPGTVQDRLPANPAWLQKRGGTAPTPVFRIAAKRDGKVISLRSGDRVVQGDGLRIIVAWKKAGFVFLLHRDAKGNWTPVYPDSPKKKGFQLMSKGRLALPGSLEVTGAPQGDEEFWACFSNNEIDYKPLLTALETLSPQTRVAPTSCHFLKRFVLSRPRGR